MPSRAINVASLNGIQPHAAQGSLETDRMPGIEYVQKGCADSETGIR
jgi:hypothetical protein